MVQSNVEDGGATWATNPGSTSLLALLKVAVGNERHSDLFTPPHSPDLTMATLRVSTPREPSSEDTVLSDIYALSTILTNYRDSDSDTAPHAVQLDRKDKQLAAFWRNLAFLLSTRTAAAKPVVAVTGNLEIAADSCTIAAAVVAAGSLPSENEEEAISQAETTCVAPIHVRHDADRARELLEDPKPRRSAIGTLLTFHRRC